MQRPASTLAPDVSSYLSLTLHCSYPGDLDGNGSNAVSRAPESKDESEDESGDEEANALLDAHSVSSEDGISGDESISGDDEISSSFSSSEIALFEDADIWEGGDDVDDEIWEDDYVDDDIWKDDDVGALLDEDGISAYDGTSVVDDEILEGDGI